MDYQALLTLFDCCDLGAILASEDNIILDYNDKGDFFLKNGTEIKGLSLQDIAPFLMAEVDESSVFFENSDSFSHTYEPGQAEATIRCSLYKTAEYANPSFYKYLIPLCQIRCQSLPADSYMIIFKDATTDFSYMLIRNIFDRMTEAVTVWDSNCRIIMLNQAAEKLESHLADDVLGKDNATLYKADKNSILAIPKVLEDKKPLLDLRQDVFTNTGKELEIISNNYPVLNNGKAVAAYSMMEDHSTIADLHNRIGELQRALTDADAKGKPVSNEEMTAHFTFSDIIYSSNLIRVLIEKSKMVAESDSSVMIYGATGTGKEMFAQSIHNASKRKNAPFLAINCAAIPDSLLESTLFGTEKGAYTGSVQRRGLLELAHNGTLLLDEINSMDIQLQAKLLRFLQEGEFRRVGGSKNIHVDVRIISNTNQAPLEAVKEGKMRSDLYYRLGIAVLTIPPLCKRKEDIPTLVQAFILKARKKTGKNVIGIDKHTLSAFFAYEWPGNVRELQHAIEYSMTILPYDKQYITPEYLPDHIINATKSEPSDTISPAPDENLVKAASQRAARVLIMQTLRSNKNNITDSARALGISRQNLQRYIKQLEIKLP